MTRKDLEAIIAKNTACTKKAAHDTVTDLVNSIVKAVAKGGELSIVGFGTFKSTKKAARTARNPRTGETIKVPAHKSPVFKAGKAFKDACKKK